MMMSTSVFPPPASANRERHSLSETTKTVSSSSACWVDTAAHALDGSKTMPAAAAAVSPESSTRTLHDVWTDETRTGNLIDEKKKRKVSTENDDQSSEAVAPPAAAEQQLDPKPFPTVPKTVRIWIEGESMEMSTDDLGSKKTVVPFLLYKKLTICVGGETFATRDLDRDDQLRTKLTICVGGETVAVRDLDKDDHLHTKLTARSNKAQRPAGRKRAHCSVQYVLPTLPSIYPDCVPRHQNDLLKDTNGRPRGAYLSLEGDDQHVLQLLRQVFHSCESKLGHVQNYTQHLLHYNMGSPGFAVTAGADDREIFSGHDSDYVMQMEAFLTFKLQRTLCEIGYCSPDQQLELYLSFLKTMKTEVQPPHVDYQWENISPKDFVKRPRSYKGNYEEWVPFIALFPLTEDGMTVEVWHARSEHHRPESKQCETGELVYIPFGKILLLRADVVHAGGFMTVDSGNPRGHFYIYKSPRGVQHDYPLSNCYECIVEKTRRPLLEFYKHHPACVDTGKVKFVRLDALRQRSKPNSTV